MHILLKTYVEQPPEKVMESFDKELFLALKPPGIGLKLLRFDGCERGDIVEMVLHFGLFKQRWKSTITDAGSSESEFYFIDEAQGKDLPFFLKKWKHRHRIIREGSGSLIVDDIEYESPLGLNLLMYPALWAQMAWRKPIYRKRFKKQEEESRV